MHRATSRGAWKVELIKGAAEAGFVVREAQFNAVFPGRNPFHSYRALTGALGSYPSFTNTDDNATRLREVAAFFANVDHETDGLKFVVEQSRAKYTHYCDISQPYGCPAGESAYHGRGPLMLSWNFHYKAAGDALHIDLLHNAFALERDPKVSWASALWIWTAQRGSGSMTSHDAMVGNRGLGDTIRTLAGNLECNGKNPDEMNDCINTYRAFAGRLGVGPGTNLSC